MTEHQKKSTITALFTIIFAVTLGFSVVNPFLPVYVKNLHTQGFTIALVFSGFTLAKILFTPVLGRWSDFGSRKAFIICGLVMHCLIAGIFVFLPENLCILVLLRFFQGIATAMVRPIAQAFVGDVSSENHEGTSMGTFDISFYAALATGPVLGGFVCETAGFRGVFLALLTLCFVALTLTLFTSSDLQTPLPDRHTHMMPRYDLFSNHTFQALLCFIFSRSFSVALIPVFLPLLIQSRIHSGYLGIGTCIASGSIVTALLLRPMGRLSDRVDRRILIITGGITSGVLTMTLPLADSLWQVILISIILAFFTSLSIPASTALLVNESRRYGLGYTMGIFHTCMNIGTFLAPLLGGILMDTLGIDSVFRAAGLLGITGSILFMLRCRWNIEKNPRPPQHTSPIEQTSHPLSPISP